MQILGKWIDAWINFSPTGDERWPNWVSPQVWVLLSGKQKEWCPDLPERYTLFHSWKVRETYEHPEDSESLIMIATDRISTHDVVHHWLIPWKGKALTQMSNYWFKYFSEHDDTKNIPNHLLNTSLPDDFPEELRNQAIVVQKLTPLPIEAIIRGYLYGSALAWYDSETWRLKTWEYVGKWLHKCSKFEKPLFTPSTKSDKWDENVNFETMVQNLKFWLQDNWYENINADELAKQIQDYSLRIYNTANSHAQEKWLILWDTKFEFALDKNWKLIVIDEVCTGDSSRLWVSHTVIEWKEPTSKDKQPVRDFVSDYWKVNPEKKKQPVQIPPAITEDTSECYQDISTIFSHKECIKSKLIAPR